MKVRQYNVKIKGQEVEIEKIVTFPITIVLASGATKIMWQAHVYSCVYEAPMYTTEPTLTASHATEKAFLACIVAKHGEPV